MIPRTCPTCGRNYWLVEPPRGGVPIDTGCDHCGRKGCLPWAACMVVLLIAVLFFGAGCTRQRLDITGTDGTRYEYEALRWFVARDATLHVKRLDDGSFEIGYRQAEAVDSAALSAAIEAAVKAAIKGAVP